MPANSIFEYELNAAKAKQNQPMIIRTPPSGVRGPIQLTESVIARIYKLPLNIIIPTPTNVAATSSSPSFNILIFLPMVCKLPIISRIIECYI